MERSPRYLLPAVLLFALLLRGGVLVGMPGALVDDPDGYRRLAENLVAHGVFGEGKIPTAYRAPLYPLVLVPCVALGDSSRMAVSVLHLAMGLATVWLVFVLGRRWGLGDRAVALAAALVACDPILLVHSTLVMTETAAALLAVCGLMALSAASKRPSALRAAIAGGTLTLAVLCRPGFLPWLVSAGVLLPALARPWLARWKLFGGFTAAAVVVLSPWAIRNHCWFGRPIVTTTHGGYTLLLANNPSFYHHLGTAPWGKVWDAGQFNEIWSLQKPRNELAADRMAYAEALENVRRRPVTFCYACLVRVGRLWQLTPHQTAPDEGALRRSARYAVGVWYLAVFVLAAFGSRCVRASPDLRWALLLVVCLTAVHAVYWSNMRMRAPLIPVVALAAAATFARREGPVGQGLP